MSELVKPCPSHMYCTIYYVRKHEDIDIFLTEIIFEAIELVASRNEKKNFIFCRVTHALHMGSSFSSRAYLYYSLIYLTGFLQQILIRLTFRSVIHTRNPETTLTQLNSVPPPPATLRNNKWIRTIDLAWSYKQQRRSSEFVLAFCINYL
jgi:hypothetical protein